MCNMALISSIVAMVTAQKISRKDHWPVAVNRVFHSFLAGKLSLIEEWEVN